ncbi:hypothetical protein EP331_06720 [bacterium]|nr:MAG: hypothetical protein EP331_06720 [bacterium]
MLVISISAFAQIERPDQDGVMWRKTLRVQGLITRMDPFNETSLYKLSEKKTDSIKIDRNAIQFEMVASKFWEALKDSIIQAVKRNRLDVYLVKEDPLRPEIFIKGTKITSYNVLLDELFLGYQKAIDASDQRNTKAVYILDKIKPDVLQERTVTRSTIKQKEDIIQLLTLFQLEMILSVDETGFKIEPLSLLIGSAHFNSLPIMEPEQDYAILDGYFNQFRAGFGIFVDLTAQNTYNFLVETGVQFSGEGNIIPFFDLITMFHYPYQFYSESDFVVAGRNDQDEIKRLMMNRYNETTFNYLYGQPPQWWESYNKGNLMNGIFKVDSTKATGN